MTAFTHRIRRCNGNRLMLYFTPLRPDGTEIDLFVPGATAATVDALINLNRAALAAPGAALEIHPSVWTSPT